MEGGLGFRVQGLGFRGSGFRLSGGVLRNGKIGKYCGHFIFCSELCTELWDEKGQSKAWEEGGLLPHVPRVWGLGFRVWGKVRGYVTQRVHVAVWYILLGPKHILYTYMDPLGKGIW